jgi:cytochrome c-type biogenesis protein
MIEIGLLSAFTAGLLSFLSPCVLPVVPVYLSLMSNKAIFKNSNGIKFSERLFLFLNSVFFVLGFSLVFIALGSTATVVGQVLVNYSSVVSRVGGGVLIIFGLNYMGLFRIPLLNAEKKFKMPNFIKANYFGSFMIGVIFSFGWVPCIGMILSGILLLASKLNTLPQGILLLSVYSLGLGVPFMLSSIFIGIFSRFLKRVSRRLRIIPIISGIFLIILGIIFITNSMNTVMSYLYSNIPFLSRLSL